MFKSTKYKIFLALLTVIILVMLVASACTFGEEPPAEEPLVSAIVAPPTGARVLVGSPVQIQSIHAAEGISRVELFVNDQLIRADVPDEGIVLQEWVPEGAGTYIIRVVAYTPLNAIQNSSETRVEVVDTPAISLITPEREFVGEEGVAFEPPEPTATVFPNPTVIGIEAIPTLQGTEVATSATAAQISVVDIAPIAVVPTPTPPLRYPPPPPAPGVPPGPTQDELPLMRPPVCDAADYVGVYAANTADRITINEDDDIAVQTVGGTQVFRAWRLRNTGTCTWGPGYELAFYGGRSMGSGGVAFESLFPSDPGRRNAIVDGNRLVVPEGRPNQVAVVEVLLNVPVTPGIHQSYWRMRNPQGVYFGPIIGVTVEVVRECEFGIYGAPVINYFNILGVGDVYRPENPVDVLAEFGDTITLEWDVINTDSFDVILRDPLGRVSALSNTFAQGRAQFIASELGTYVVTLYADNGPCTVSQDVNIVVVPRGEDRFQLDIILSPTSASANVATDGDVAVAEELDAGNIIAQWQHFDPEVDQFLLVAQLYRRVQQRQCPFVDSIFGWTGHCYRDWGEWMATGQRRVVPIGQEAEGAAVVTNIESELCPDAASPAEEYGIKYVMEARKNGQPAVPQYSNPVDVICGGVPSTGTGDLPVEIQGTFNP